MTVRELFCRRKRPVDSGFRRWKQKAIQEFGLQPRIRDNDTEGLDLRRAVVKFNSPTLRNRYYRLCY